jgi:hypothetical protein
MRTRSGLVQGGGIQVSGAETDKTHEGTVAGHHEGGGQKPLEGQQSDNWNEYTAELQALCVSKAEEFHLLGYEAVTAPEIWQCAQNILKGRGQIHQVVEAILGLNIGKFMTRATINAYQGKFGDEA